MLCEALLGAIRALAFANSNNMDKVRQVIELGARADPAPHTVTGAPATAAPQRGCGQPTEKKTNHSSPPRSEHISHPRRG